MEILKSKDYDQFSTITGNRVISKKKIDSLVSDIKSGLDLLEYCPIIVYKSEDGLMIVDGQHRFETSKKLARPVYYVVCKELDLKQVTLLNSRSDKWKTKDFLNCYIQIGIEDYKILGAFVARWGVGYTTAVDLLMVGRVNGQKNSMEKFRNGEFKCKHLELAEEIVGLTKDIFDRYVFSTDKYLIAAVHELKKVGKCDFEILKEKVNSAPMLMDKQNSWKDYIYNIERVYNHQNHKRIVIF